VQKYVAKCVTENETHFVTFLLYLRFENGKITSICGLYPKIKRPSEENELIIGKRSI